MSGECHSGSEGLGESDAVNAVVGRLVRRGVVSREALLGARVAEKAVDAAVRRRFLHPFMGDGVYLVGHPDPPPLAREYAALLVGGERSVISHWSAAVLWRLVREAPDAKVHLILSAQRRNTVAIRFHRATLMSREVRTLHGDLRLTSPARTLADLAGDLDEETLERAVADAIRRRLTTERELARYAAGRRRGARKLRAILQLDGGAQWTRSKAEQEFLKLVRAAGLPPPRMNRRVDGKGRDAVWDDEKVIAEIDGWTFHGVDPVAFEADRSRGTGSAARGWMPLSFSYKRIRDHPLAVAAELSAVLRLRGP